MSIDEATVKEWDAAVRATRKQVGGMHYKKVPKGMQPVEFSYAHGLSPNLTNVVKYIVREKDDRIGDLLKAIHYIELELELVHKVDPTGNKLAEEDSDEFIQFCKEQFFLYKRDQEGNLNWYQFVGENYNLLQKQFQDNPF
jgi:hypothetical protein